MKYRILLYSKYLFFFSFIFLYSMVHSLEWKLLNSGISDDLHDVFFIDDVGWAYTYGTGIVIKTNNNGKTWEKLSQLPPLYYEQILFINKKTGWICGDKGSILKTDDGGKTWTDQGQSIKKTFSEARILYYAMHNFDKESLLIGGIAFLPDKKKEFLTIKTNNGGRYWQKIKSPPQDFITCFYFIDRKTGFASGQQKIFHTIDGGQNWRIVFKAEKKRTGIRSMDFINKSTGFATTQIGKIIKTTDGGNKWSSKLITSNRLRSIIFTSKKQGYIVGDKNKEPGTLFETTNKGKTWNLIKMPPIDLHRIKRSTNYLWIVGKKGTILRARL